MIMIMIMIIIIIIIIIINNNNNNNNYYYYNNYSRFGIPTRKHDDSRRRHSILCPVHSL